MSNFEKQKELVLSELGSILGFYGTNFSLDIDSVEDYDTGADEVIVAVVVSNTDRPGWTCRMELLADTEEVRLEIYDDTYEELTNEVVWRYMFFDLLEMIK